MVNSGACRSLPSPFRHTRASWKIGPAPPTSSFFMANSGLVCSQSGSLPPSGKFAFGAEGAQMDLLAGGGDGVGRLHLGVAARGEERAGGLPQQGPTAQERQARGQAFGVP